MVCEVITALKSSPYIISNFKKGKVLFCLKIQVKYFLKTVTRKLFGNYLCIKNILKKGIKLFKIISALEAISFIVLLCVAMPLKYIWDMPQLVQIVGMAHGVLFILYIVFTIHAWQVLQWSFKKLSVAIVCSVVPFGPFYVERNYL